jgi:hypothetical protein
MPTLDDIRPFEKGKPVKMLILPAHELFPQGSFNQCNSRPKSRNINKKDLSYIQRAGLCYERLRPL